MGGRCFVPTKATPSHRDVPRLVVAGEGGGAAGVGVPGEGGGVAADAVGAHKLRLPGKDVVGVGFVHHVRQLGENLWRRFLSYIAHTYICTQAENL